MSLPKNTKIEENGFYEILFFKTKVERIHRQKRYQKFCRWLLLRTCGQYCLKYIR